MNKVHGICLNCGYPYTYINGTATHYETHLTACNPFAARSIHNTVLTPTNAHVRHDPIADLWILTYTPTRATNKIAIAYLTRADAYAEYYRLIAAGVLPKNNQAITEIL